MNNPATQSHNEVVHALGAIVPLSPVDSARVVSGTPTEGFVEVAQLAEHSVGIWELRGGCVTDTEGDEIFVVVSGSAKITFVAENRIVEVTAGDVVRLTAGTRTQWYTSDHIRKVYFSTH